MSLTRDSILAADDLKREEVAVPEWGGSVFVRVMTGTERERFEGAYDGLKSKHQVRSLVAVLTVCDEAGKPLFTEADVEAVGAKSGAALDRVFEVATRLAKVTKADVDALEKN